MTNKHRAEQVALQTDPAWDHTLAIEQALDDAERRGFERGFDAGCEQVINIATAVRKVTIEKP